MTKKCVKKQKNPGGDPSTDWRVPHTAAKKLQFLATCSPPYSSTPGSVSISCSTYKQNTSDSFNFDFSSELPWSVHN